jgi:hypothetical protein
MMESQNHKPGNGQILVIFAIGLTVMVALAALILESGQTYLHRRQAQAAADAGALAGARLMCAGSNSDTAVITAAQNYAIQQNGATTAAGRIETTSGRKEVVLDVTIQQNSFMGVFGTGSMPIPASAAAACFPAGGPVMPIAWSCKAPVGGSSDSPDCEILNLDWITEFKPLIDSDKDYFKSHIRPELYIFMDSGKIDEHCISQGGVINCDSNGDGVDDFKVGGGRSWLDLNGGGGGSSELITWIEGQFNGQLRLHQWVPEQSGVSTNVFHALDCSVIGTNKNGCRNPKNPVILPVFNYFCNGKPTLAGNESCLTGAHTDPADISLDQVISQNNNSTYFHLVGFAPIYVTCVDDGNAGCPGHDALVDAATKGSVDKNIKTIEGYFLRGYDFNLLKPEIGGVDVGLEIPSLTR